MSFPPKGSKNLDCCKNFECIKIGTSHFVIGHHVDCARNRKQIIFVAPCHESLVGKTRKIARLLNRRDFLNGIKKATRVSFKKIKCIYPSLQWEQTHLRDLLNQLDGYEHGILASIKAACQKHGLHADYVIVDKALRLRGSVTRTRRFMRPAPASLAAALKEWVMGALGDPEREKEVEEVWMLVQSGKLVALCTGHCDAFRRRGFLHPDTLEVLTISCAAKDQPVYVVVAYMDLRTTWGVKLANEGKVAIRVFKVYDGQSIVFKGAAGQVCCHLVLGPVDTVVMRLRLFLRPTSGQ